jgi:hypothetical protein
VDPVIRTVPELISLIAAHHATVAARVRPVISVVVTRSRAQLAVVLLERASGPVLADHGHPDDVPGADLNRPAVLVLHPAELGPLSASIPMPALLTRTSSPPSAAI